MNASPSPSVTVLVRRIASEPSPDEFQRGLLIEQRRIIRAVIDRQELIDRDRNRTRIARIVDREANGHDVAMSTTPSAPMTTAFDHRVDTFTR